VTGLNGSAIVTTGDAATTTLRVGSDVGDDISVSFSGQVLARTLGTAPNQQLSDLIRDDQAVATIGEANTLLDSVGAALNQVGASYVGRISWFRMSSPLDDAFNMDVLDARERATNTGIEIAVGSGVSAIAIFAGSRLIDGGDFTTPFLIMADAYVVSTAIYWRVFRPLDREVTDAAQPP
jgi:hypothetical protein